MPFISDDFLLHTSAARRLYHEYAAPEPIFDYHCHLSPQQIAENYRFRNLADLWLAGDHYKWRAMRTNGVAERFCTGDAPDREKFLAWARTVPATLRNPLYHWTHLELKRYFGIDTLLDETTADAVWEKANALLATPEFTVHGLLAKSRVKVVCTTDDPADDLRWHQEIKKSGLATRVYPTFRPDKALLVNKPEPFNSWIAALEKTADVEIKNFASLLEALKRRHDFFHLLGGRLSDHGLENALAEDCTEAEASRIFENARAGRAATPEETVRYGSFLMLVFGHLDHARGWVKQLHVGAMRNNNTRLLRALGPDTGFDSIGDFSQGRALSRYLDRLDSTNQLPKTILYNLNPADNYLFATLIGNFQDGSVAGKIQFGSGWWFLDQKEGMEWQLNALSNLGLLRRFIGMLTDSRSFVSYPRHEYFRRVLCNLLGAEMERGELPHDLNLIGPMVRDICYQNARAYFPLEVAE
jgi:glucuronate isomerase